MAYLGNMPGTGKFNGVYTISANTSAAQGFVYVCLTSLTLTLPLNPLPNDVVGICNMSNTTTITINRNGSNIMSLAENMVIDSTNASFTLIYVDSTNGWVII